MAGTRRVCRASRATTGNQFRLTDGQWHFNLPLTRDQRLALRSDAVAPRVKGLSTRTGFSTGTWKLIATLSDGSTHYVWITIKK